MKYLLEWFLCSAIFVTISSPAVISANSPNVSTTALNEYFQEISIFDGSNNCFKIFRESPGEKILLRFEPVAISQSSSGVYDGGTPKECLISEEQFEKIQAKAREIANNKSLHLEKRKMGTFLVKVKSIDSFQNVIVGKNSKIEVLISEIQSLLAANP